MAVTFRTGPGVPVPGFDPASLPRKPAEAPEPPREKIARSLAAKLRPTDPNATTEVIVSVAHDAHFSPLPKLLRNEPRSSTENSRRVAARLSAMAAVDARRKPFRTAVANHASGHGALVTEEFTVGNGLAMTIPDSAVEALANHPNVLDVSPRYDGTPPPGTIANGTSLATGMNSDFWRPGNDGNTSGFFMIAFDTGVRSTHTVFNVNDRGILGRHGDCVRGNSECVNNPVNLFYNDQDPVYSHGTATANIIMGGNSSVPGFGINFRGVARPTLDYVNVYHDINGADAVAVSRAYARAAVWGDDVIVAELQMPLTDASQPSLAADDAFDQGIAVIGAVGNTTDVRPPRLPATHTKLSRWVTTMPCRARPCLRFPVS